jgi:hypothetical protein
LDGCSRCIRLLGQGDFEGARGYARFFAGLVESRHRYGAALRRIQLSRAGENAMYDIVRNRVGTGIGLFHAVITWSWNVGGETFHG